MIDFHTHVLPGMDDGSGSVAQSLRMLHKMAEQGVDLAVATPHYYRKENTPEAFLERRKNAFEKLQAVYAEGVPQIFLGAEIAYFDGISRTEDLGVLCVEGTKTLLLEMPFRPWDGAILDEVLALTERYTVVLAHIERYWFMQPKRVRKRVLHSACRLQINAMGLCLWPLSAIERNCLRRGVIQVIGSDCHGHLFRPPCMGWAWRRLRKHLGEEKLRQLDADMRKLIEP